MFVREGAYCHCATHFVQPGLDIIDSNVVNSTLFDTIFVQTVNLAAEVLVVLGARIGTRRGIYSDP